MDTRCWPATTGAPRTACCWCRLVRCRDVLRLVGGRLPSESEWEGACRAGTKTPFSFGTHTSPGDVNYDCRFPFTHSKDLEYRGRTVPVGTLSANGWGFHEMHGNVWEWCDDWLDTYGIAPRDGSAQQQDSGSGLRVLRGGSWDDRAEGCRSSSRLGWRPGDRRDDAGFRPARSLYQALFAASSGVARTAPNAPSILIRRLGRRARLVFRALARPVQLAGSAAIRTVLSPLPSPS